MKKLLSLVLVLAMALLSVAALGEGETTLQSGGIDYVLSPEGYPIMSEPVTVKTFVVINAPEGAGAWESPNEIPLFKNYNEKTNIAIDWETVSFAAWSERAYLLLASDDLPEVFLKCAFTNADLAKYGSEGLFVNLEDKLETHAPDFYNFMAERDLLKYLHLGEGIWGFPYVFETEGVRIGKLFVNQRWLNNVGMEMPTNWDELYDVMVAFRDQDANGNGDATDEVPAAFGSRADMIYDMAGEYGLCNRGYKNAYIDADPADESGNTLRFWYADEALKDVLKMAKVYYDEGFIPKTFFDASSDLGAKMDQDMIGLHDNYATIVGAYVDDFIAMPKSPSDLWSVVGGYLSSYGSMVITKECKVPEAMMSWANYFYTIPGAYDYCLGIEGESYIINDEGHTELTDLILHNPDGLSQEQALIRYSIYSGGKNPVLLTDDTFKGGECYWTSLEGSANFKPYLPPVVWESIPLTTEATEIISNTKGDIDAVIAEYTAEFITGKRDIDADWDEYISKLEQAGMEDYVWAYQDSYNALNGL